MATSTEVVTLEQVEDVLLHGGDMQVLSEEQIQQDMVRRILTEGTLEEAFDGFRATPAADMEGIGVTVKGIAWLRSAFEQGPAVYALLDAEVTETKEPVKISMGGHTLMASFVRAIREEAMPLSGAFVREKSRTNPERSFWTFKLAPRTV